MMLPPHPLTILTDVGKQGGLLLVKHRRHVHVGVRQKSPGLATRVDFKEEEVCYPQICRSSDLIWTASPT